MVLDKSVRQETDCLPNRGVVAFLNRITTPSTEVMEIC